MKDLQAKYDEKTESIIIYGGFSAKDLLKLVPGRRYNASFQRWEFPPTMQTVHSLRRLGIKIDEEPIACRETLLQGSLIVKHSRYFPQHFTGFKFKTEPYTHQLTGMAYLLALPKAALLWDMGVGKTKTVIDAAEYRRQVLSQVHKVLVICPNSLKYNWADQIEEHSYNPSYVVLSGTWNEKRKALQKQAMWYIVSVENVAQLLADLQQKQFDMIVIDEATRIKNRNAQRTKAVMELHAPYKIILTGTPSTNSPLDVWAPFSWLDPSLLGSYWEFEKRYCTKRVVAVKDVIDKKSGYMRRQEIKQVVAYKNLDELQKKLEMRSLRYLKEDVLDLPPKTYHNRIVEMIPEQARHYVEMQESLKTEFRDMTDEEFRASASTVLTKLLRLAQITSGVIGSDGRYGWIKNNAKYQELTELLEELGNEKVVIWCRFVFEIEKLMELLAEHNPVAIYGAVSAQERQEIVNRFQREKDVRLFIGQINTAGFGITLTAAQNAVYYSRDFSLEAYLQSQDRIYRIGQTGTVNIIHLMCQGTIDQYIAEKLARKEDMASKITGDEIRKVLGGRKNG